jgi:disulfide bond formation protein DsbB
VTQQSTIPFLDGLSAEQLTWGLLLASAAIILTALGFEYIGHYQPCPLCLQQRWAYYAGIAGLIGTLLAFAAGQRQVAGILLALIGLAFLMNMVLGIYHSGVEWHWWAGPTTCSGAGPSTDAGDLLKKLETVHVVRCDEAQWRFALLSFAGWNAVLSLGLSALSVLAYRRAV